MHQSLLVGLIFSFHSSASHVISPIYRKSYVGFSKNPVWALTSGGFRIVSDTLEFASDTPIMGSLKSRFTTSCRSSIDTIALNCLVFEKIALFPFWRQTDEQMDSTDALSRSYCRERQLNKQVVIKQRLKPFRRYMHTKRTFNFTIQKFFRSGYGYTCLYAKNNNSK